MRRKELHAATSSAVHTRKLLFSRAVRFCPLACEAMDEWIRERIEKAMTLPARKDHTVAEAYAYRDGIEDVTDSVAEWEKFWGEA